MQKLERKFKKVSIKGKEYVEVKERILALVDSEIPYAINTEHWYYPDRKMWVVKATLTIIDTMESFTGLAQELEDDKSSMVNKTSALENAETSAVGRACAFAGIGVIDSIASADEVHKAINREASKTKTVDTPNGGTKEAYYQSKDEHCPECGTENPTKVGTTKTGKPYELADCGACAIRYFINRKN